MNTATPRSDPGTLGGGFYPDPRLQQRQDPRQDQLQQRQYGHHQLQPRPQIKKKRKTFNFAFPFLALRFKKFQVELSEYN